MKTIFAIRVSRDIAQFIEVYPRENNIESRSKVIERALKRLREEALQQAYFEAGQEGSSSEDATLWEMTSTDGLG